MCARDIALYGKPTYLQIGSSGEGIGWDLNDIIILKNINCCDTVIVIP